MSVGPDLIIVDDALKFVPPGSGGKGNILIRGPPCFGEPNLIVAVGVVLRILVFY